ncbi:hypothetical protein GCM10020001_003910 [Nonomuraea salmonea]
MRTVEAIDSSGVMPEPAATHRWRSPPSGSACQEPVGGCTSMTVPGRTSWTSQEENRPPGISLTPMRGAAPAGAQIEYERRSSRPSAIRRRVSDWPALNAYVSRSSGGTSKVIAAASSHSRSTAATVSGWKTAALDGAVAGMVIVKSP